MSANAQTIAFDQYNLDFVAGSIANGTSLQFGPDGLLYATERYGLVHVYTITRNPGPPVAYQVIAAETISLVQSIPNHMDDGTLEPTKTDRQVTGLAVGGTAGNVEVYVTSSDSEVGAGGGGGDANLDTNSGVITRLTRNGSGWDAVDIVRGLPRSEENHAPNGLEVVTIAGRDDNLDMVDDRFLIVAVGGLTNAGSPSNNFAFISEYALSAAVIAVNLDLLEDLPILNDGVRDYIYDLPTLDDPTRANVGPDDPDDPGYTGVDVGDPWGGNDGLNMAMVVPDGPVQLFSPGYRNAYDLVVTQAGKVYVTDNGANGGWGGFPENEATANVNNNYRTGEPGSNGTDVANGNEPQVNNQDHLNLVTTDINSYDFGSTYGGHPSPVRANVNAGLFTCDTSNCSTNGVFRTTPFDPNGMGDAADSSLALPANWPPVPAPDVSITRTSDFINVANGDYRQPNANNPDGPDDITVTSWQNNTNGVAEYTASNFGGRLQGALVAGRNGGDIHVVTVDPTTGLLLTDDPATTDLVEGLDQNKFNVGGNPLGITTLGDSGLFPGTIWITPFNSAIVVLEPNDFVICVPPLNPNDDNDFDGFTNQDEADNGTDPCSGASRPNDFDDDKVSDLNDLNDDGDAINDDADPFQLGVPANLPVLNELFSDTLLPGGAPNGYLGLGLTGLMNNTAVNPNWLDWIDRTDQGTNPNDILGGAIGAVTIQQTGGTAASAANNQEKAYQYGVNVSTATGPFTVSSRMSGLTEPGQLYTFTPVSFPPAQGIQIGTGFQDNYIEFVVTQAGVTLREEVNDSTSEQIDVVINPGDRPAGAGGQFILMLLVDPVAGTVEGQYIIDSDPAVSVGTISAQGAVLAAIQNSANPLAIGLIGTSGAPQTPDPNDDLEFAATWDNLIVTGSAPFLGPPLPDLDRQIDDPAEMINLDNFFDDDNGVAGLTYSLEGNTNTAIGASLAGNMLTITYPSTPETTMITIRATDADTFFIEDTFMVTVSDEPMPFIRINAGGATVTADDGGPNWEANTVTGATSGPSYTVNIGNIFAGGIAASTGRHPTIPSYVSDTVFNGLFAQERWDPAGAPEMLWTIPVPNGSYVVNLYFGNSFAGTSAAGQRVYDINIEGGALEVDDLDLSGTYGHLMGAMESYPVSVADGDITIELLHNVENPLINAIEVLAGSSVSIPITVNPVPNQASVEGFFINLPVIAGGGDGALAYSAMGLPPGLNINATNGVISGTIAGGAASAIPYDVTITVDDADADSADAMTAMFAWTVSAAPLPGSTLFRVNAGGPAIAGMPISWSEDQTAGAPGGAAETGLPSPYLDLSGASADSTFGGPLGVGGTNGTGVPDNLFTTERFSAVAGMVDNLSYDFPVVNGDYTVNLYFAEIFVDAQTSGFRVFDVMVEGALVLDDFDPFATFGLNAGVQSFNVTVSDQNLDLDFVQDVAQNPAIKAIEIIDNNALPNPDADATVMINPGTGIGSSTFTNDSFSITNNSSNGLQITEVTINLSSAIFPEMVFDPLGTAGDATAKCFNEDSGGTVTGLITDGSGSGNGSCLDPFSGPRGNGGFDALTLQFGDFDPGETLTFSVDVDPTSIEGVPGAGGAGSVSGLELAGSQVHVTFSDGTTTLIGELYRIPASDGGSTNDFLPDPLTPPPGLVLPGALINGSSPGVINATVGSLSTIAQISGPVGANVVLLQIQADRTVAITDPFEANDAVAVIETTATIGAGGTVDVALTLTDNGADELNYLAAVITEGDGRTSNLSDIWRVNFDPTATVITSALIQINPGGDLASTTFSAGAFIIDNIGTVDITQVTFDLSSGFLPDVVFDPTGTAGDSGAKCFTADSGATETGLATDGSGTGPGSCTVPFSSPHNGVDDADGYDVMTIDFNDFQGGEVFTFSTDNDPTSIKNDVTTGDAGAISGFELIGATVTVEFANGAMLTGNLFDESSLGGSMAMIEAGIPAAPVLALSGFADPIALPDAAQSIIVTGTPGTPVSLLQVDARLYIDAGGGGYDIDPFEANDAMGKVVANAVIEPDGDVEIPVTLLATPTSDAGPDGGINHFIAVHEMNGPTPRGLTSNTVVVEFDPGVMLDGTLEGTMTLQGRVDNSGDFELKLYDLSGVQVGSPMTVTADASGQFTVPGITPGMYQVALKRSNYLQIVQTIDIVAGTTVNDFGEAAAGDANNDNFVTLVDFSILASTFNASTDLRADFNGDGSVTLIDFSLLVGSFNMAGEVPSP
jgi:hypothetical protein